jgi:chromosome segregation ATPase
MVTDGAVAQDRLTELIDDLGRAFHEESALALRLDDLRSYRAELHDELRGAREDASRSAFAAARHEIELLVAAACERIRTAEYDLAEQAARAGAERRALTARLERIEALCDELLAGIARLADAAREPTIVIDDRRPDAPRRERRYLFHRGRRDGDSKRERHDKAISDRINRVTSPITGVTTPKAEEVEARIRNMSHGTNGL